MRANTAVFGSGPNVAVDGQNFRKNQEILRSQDLIFSSQLKNQNGGKNPSNQRVRSNNDDQGKISYQNVGQLIPAKKEPSWGSMAFRALKGERSPEIVAWQNQNRSKASSSIVSFSDGISEYYEETNSSIRNFKFGVHDKINKKIDGLNQALQVEKTNDLSLALVQTQKAFYQASGFIADNVLPNSINEVSVGIIGGALGATILDKTIRKPLTAYEAYKKGQKIVDRPASDRIQHEALKIQYRQNMEKPPVQDPQLRGIIEELYRPNAKLGSGSTADAARFELKTFKKVEGQWHVQKCQDSIRFLEKWIENNPTARLSDRAAAENVLLDLKDGIGQKPWYSQTKPPKW